MKNLKLKTKLISALIALFLYTGITVPATPYKSKPNEKKTETSGQVNKGKQEKNSKTSISSKNRKASSIANEKKDNDIILDFNTWWDERESEIDEFLASSAFPTTLDSECSFKTLGEIFGDYKYYFKELYYAAVSIVDWTILSLKYKCNNVLAFILSKEKMRFKRVFEPANNKSGIKTGLVIAYGILIKPPYKISIDSLGKYIYINDIQVWPLMDLQKISEPKYPGRRDKITSLLEIRYNTNAEIKKAYKENINMWIKWALKYKGEKEAKKILISYLSNQKEVWEMITDYKIFGPNMLDFDVKMPLFDYWDEEISNPFSKKDEPDNHPKYRIDENTLNKFLNSNVVIIQQYLDQNKILIFSKSYSYITFKQVLSKEDMKAIIDIINSTKEYYNRILKLGNYNEEWKWIISKEIAFNLNKSDCAYIENYLETKR